MSGYPHQWFDCEMCGASVLCGLCGNNCCNGGYGTLPDGTTCHACPSAYAVQDGGPPTRDGPGGEHWVPDLPERGAT